MILLLMLLCLPLSATPISASVHDEIMKIADAEGVPRSVANQLQIEESGEWQTRTWGNPLAHSQTTDAGFRSWGLYQIYFEPGNLAFLIDTFWKGRDEKEAFEWSNPIHSAKLGLRYMAYLHKVWGSWYLAACHYNGTRGEPSEATKAYALRIVRAP